MARKQLLLGYLILWLGTDEEEPAEGIPGLILRGKFGFKVLFGKINHPSTNLEKYGNIETFQGFNVFYNIRVC